MPVRPLKYIQITESLWKDPRNDQNERQEVRSDVGPSGSIDDLSLDMPVRPLKYIQITQSLWKDPRNDQNERQEVRSDVGPSGSIDDFKLGGACKAAQVHTNYRVVVEGS